MPPAQLIEVREDLANNAIFDQHQILQGMVSLRITSVTRQDVQNAINGRNQRVLGRGGFGTVYSAKWRGKNCAIKVRDTTSLQGAKEFIKEINILGNHKHDHLVPLLGFCISQAGSNLYCPLIYPKLKSSLEDALCVRRPLGELSAKDRLVIAKDAAAGLAFLHSAVNKPVILHRDMKSSNILLDNHKRAKISDVGLARPMQAAESYTQGIGTFGYIDPCYGSTGQYLTGSDVFSFGVILLELLTGQKATDSTQRPPCLHEWCRIGLLQNPSAFVDRSVQWPILVTDSFVRVSLDCINPTMANRPNAQAVVERLGFISELLQAPAPVPAAPAAPPPQWPPIPAAPAVPPPQWPPIPAAPAVPPPQWPPSQWPPIPEVPAAPPSAPPSAPPQATECSICMENPLQARLQPCCHVFCRVCAHSFVARMCPTCSVAVASVDVGDFHHSYVPVVAV
jgi:serine/threonine protein kinase